MIMKLYKKDGSYYFFVKTDFCNNCDVGINYMEKQKNDVIHLHISIRGHDCFEYNFSDTR